MKYVHKFNDKQLFEFALRVKCNQDDVPMEEILSKTRKRSVVEARMMVSKLLLNEGLSYSEIARFLSKDHATIIHYRNLHDDLIDSDPQYREKFEKLIVAFRYEIVTKDAGQWREFVEMANKAYNKYGWGVEMLKFLYSMEFLDKDKR
jgi:Trp operon repressor